MIFFFTLFLGGFNLFFGILDLYAWITTIYVINVQFPLNVERFFDYCDWSELFLLPTPEVLNRPQDSYYQEAP